MQPQQPTPSQQFDFITQSGTSPAPPVQPPNKIKKIAIMAVMGIFILAVLLVGYSAIANRGKGTEVAYVGLVARGQEIIRVSEEVNQLAQDPPTQNLSSTVGTTLTSQQDLLTILLKSQKVKLSKLQLNADKDVTVDSQMQTAATNGNLSSIYGSYLKTELARYSTDLNTTYKTAGPKGKVILKTAYDSTQVILKSSQVASAN